jgi:chromosome segregation ATPase
VVPLFLFQEDARVVKWLDRLKGIEEENEGPSPVHFQREWTAEMKLRQAAEQKINELSQELGSLREANRRLSEASASQEGLRSAHASLSSETAVLRRKLDEAEARAAAAERNASEACAALDRLKKMTESLKNDSVEMRSRLWSIAREAMGAADPG